MAVYNVYPVQKQLNLATQYTKYRKNVAVGVEYYIKDSRKEA